MDIIDESKAIIQPLNSEWYNGVAKIDMLRLDLLHPVISGNKWYKLKHNIRYAISSGFNTILTFGGGYSNHLVATAAATNVFNVRSIGIVRGNYELITPTLQKCVALGMQLLFVSKDDYSRKEETNLLRDLGLRFDDLFIIPEGGANEQGRVGAKEIADLIPSSYTHICVSGGTGTTLIGLRNGLPVSQQILGFIPMKGGKYLDEYISKHLPLEKNTNKQLFDEWHFGGFGKWNDRLIEFMNDFYQVNSIPLDIVYTGKMMYGLKELLKNGFFSEQDTILCVHTGGLQGNASISNKLCYIS
ncbi:MAG TPA: pyridoxal-phosphate dependent enzyme [Flavipsychrobacter sp.]|nr:pyridoxal-phosphate dependent enzyme [Flavipsychrobacter sp.]